MRDLLDDVLGKRAPLVLAVFCLALVGLNVANGGFHEGWDLDGFRLYLTQPIMQTTLFDFACVLGVLTMFIHMDARKHGLTYWWILPTYPVMPTIGILLYLVVRHRKLARG